MKSLVIATSFLCSALAAAVPENKNDFHLFLLGGQSNMSGRGTLNATNRVPHDRILVMSENGTWRDAVEPFHWDKRRAGRAGLAATFARAYADAHPDVKVGLIPVAYGGSPIGAWQPGARHYTNAVHYAKLAAKDGVIKGFLWHQGESDAFTMKRLNAYLPKFTNAITSLRKELGIEGVPFLAGELGPYLKDWYEEKRPNLYWQEMNAEIAKGVKLLPRAITVSAAGLYDVKKDKIHFETPSLRRFGLRYYSAYRAVEMQSGDFRLAWCNAGDGRPRMEPLSSELESLSTMTDEWRKNESVRADGTCYFDFSQIKPEKGRDFFLNLRSRAGFNSRAYYFGKFVHDREEYGRFLEEHPNFIGFESWEWGNDAYLPIRKPKALTLPGRRNHLNAKELEQVLSRVRMPPDRDGFVDDILRPAFDRLSEWHYDDPKRLLIGEGHYCIGHLAAYWGAGQIGIETTRDYLFWQIQMMFCRGAAHQFDVPWKWYIASYLGGRLNGKFQDGSYFAEPDGKRWHGPEFGISQSAVKRATYMSYLSGANWYERENMSGTHFLVKNGPPRLSDEGKMYDRFHAFTRRVKRGKPLVPFALLVPANRGYTRKAGPAFDRYAYTRPDHMLDAVMSVILDFPRNKRLANFTNRVERVMANSRFGDVFNALTPDFPDQTSFARTIGAYRAAFLIGDYGRNAALTSILRRYVESGGMLVMSSAQFDTFPVDTAKLAPMENPEFSSARIGKGTVIVGRTPYFVSWEGDDAAEKAVACVKIGDPVRFPHLEWLIARLQDKLLPVKVKGGVQFGVNELDDGLLVYLINNEGVVKFPDKVQEIAPGGTSVEVDFGSLGNCSVSETVEDRHVASGVDRVRITVPYGEVRVLKIVPHTPKTWSELRVERK